MLSTTSHMAVEESREAAYASTVPLHASSVVRVEVAVLARKAVAATLKHDLGLPSGVPCDEAFLR